MLLKIRATRGGASRPTPVGEIITELSFLRTINLKNIHLDTAPLPMKRPNRVPRQGQPRIPPLSPCRPGPYGSTKRTWGRLPPTRRGLIAGRKNNSIYKYINYLLAISRHGGLRGRQPRWTHGQPTPDRSGFRLVVDSRPANLESGSRTPNGQSPPAGYGPW